ncbi:D-alanyl-D-alanine carboxypeptidase [Rhodobacteraceae bacterium]|nr:D-alanyl-D-alanine carboxypeptidase [Paracoccaceae bacterium]
MLIISSFAKKLGCCLILLAGPFSFGLSTPLLAYPFATFVLDAATGEKLYGQNSNTKLHPASLTKMMTLYLTFREVEEGRLRLDQRVLISKNASREPPSKFGYKVGQKVSIRFLIRAAAIRSANDAATALGEAISGSEAEFANYMTRAARSMGMDSTTFKNANGLTASAHLSTARDMALLGHRLIYDFPEYYHLFGRSSVVSLGRTLYNTNRKFLASYSGADGIKTGFTSAAGFNLAASAKRGNKRVVAVVFGSGSVKLRTRRMTELLNIGFAKASSSSRQNRLPPLKLSKSDDLNDFESGLVLISIPPLRRPNIKLTYYSPDLKKINEIIEGILVTKVLENDVIQFDRNKPLERPKFGVNEDIKNSTNFTDDNIESKLLQVIVAKDLRKSFSVLVGSYYTEFNAKKDLSKLALSDLETLGAAEHSISKGVVNQKKVFRVRFTGLKKSEAIKACQKLMARNELCEIVDIEQ